MIFLKLHVDTIFTDQGAVKTIFLGPEILVQSSSSKKGEEDYYVVNVQDWMCTCGDRLKLKRPCKHVVPAKACWALHNMVGEGNG